MTGSSYSAIRAGVMFLLWLGAQVTGRTFDRLTALGAAAILILIRQPLALTDAGFLLSFGCILSLALLEPVFSDIWTPTSGIPAMPFQDVFPAPWHFRPAFFHVSSGFTVRQHLTESLSASLSFRP